MRETVASWSARTAARYTPPEALRTHGRALRDDEPCPALFRYPGACGLEDELAGRTVERLGPAWSDVLWLGDAPGHSDARGAAHFGAIVFPEALRLHPVVSDGPWAPVTTEGRAVTVYVAANGPVESIPRIWVPPAAFDRVDWEAVRTVADVRDSVPDWEARRFEVAQRLSAYLEELDGLRRAGAPGPEGPWCDVDPAVRAEALERYAVTSRWSPGSSG